MSAHSSDNKVLVKEMFMGDCEDPYLYAAFPLCEWQETEEGRYIIKNSKKEPVFYCMPDPERMGFVIRIYAELYDEALTFYNLKYRNIK